MSENMEVVETPAEDSAVEVVSQFSERELATDHVAREQHAKAVKEAEQKANAESKQPGKPWEPKEKTPTPKWARERFREYSEKTRSQENQITQLTQTVQDLLKAFAPKTPTEPKPEEFASPQEFAKFEAKRAAAEHAAQAKDEVIAEIERREEVKRLQEADARNTQIAVQADLPDYDEVIRGGDPSLTLPRDVVKHLMVSPAGPYVRYRLAQDDELVAQLKGATPQQKVAIIAGVHDAVLEDLSKRYQNGGQQTQQATTQPAAKQQPAAGRVATQQAPVRKAPPPAAPPKARGVVSTQNLHALSADDYVRARNEQRRGGR